MLPNIAYNYLHFSVSSRFLCRHARLHNTTVPLKVTLPLLRVLPLDLLLLAAGYGIFNI